MKTKNVINRIIIGLFVIFISTGISLAQSKPKVAIISIDTKGMELDNTSLGNLLRLELEKANVFEVLDKYDVNNIIERNGIDVNNCFGKSKLIEVGKLLGADKMLTGSAEVFGEKIIFILRLVDIKAETIEKTDVMEYINQQAEIQMMTRISINNLLEIENDQHIVDLLANFNHLITSPKTTVKLNGPRMGATWTSGENGKRLEAPENQGGFNMYPITSMFGYQYEMQYLSAGNFQALFEFIGALNGLESGKVVPSLTLMNGFRFNGSGWEFGLGPIFRGVRTATGYYDDENKWHLENEMPQDIPYNTQELIDNRGDIRMSTSLIVAIGRTFKSGYLNVPVNLYVSPRKQGTVVGITFGFNVAKMPKL